MGARGRRIATPAWALTLANKVWQAETGEAFSLPLIFKDRTHIEGLEGFGTRGQTRNQWGRHRDIWVEVGRQTTRRSTKIVLIHELAHALLPVSVNHSSVFYERLFPMYEKYLTPAELKDAVEHELWYKTKGATSVARTRPKIARYV